MKNQYNFDNGYTDIAGLNAALYSGPYIKELDKIDSDLKHKGPLDDDGTVYPLTRETDLSGRLLDTVEGAIGYRKNKAGRRVLVDSTLSEIRRGSRRPIGRVSSAQWNKLTSDEKRAWAKKVEEEKRRRDELPVPQGTRSSLYDVSLFVQSQIDLPESQIKASVEYEPSSDDGDLFDEPMDRPEPRTIFSYWEGA